MTPEKRHVIGAVIGEMRYVVDNLDDVAAARGSVPRAIEDWADRLLYAIDGPPREPDPLDPFDLLNLRAPRDTPIGVGLLETGEQPEFVDPPGDRP